MVHPGLDWTEDLDLWLEPFIEALGHRTRRRMCPAYIAGLIGPGDRKSVQPIAARDNGVSYDQLHHFIGSGVWDAAPLEAALLVEADKLVGGEDAWLIIDDTALPKKGRHSVGVAPQYASALGKTANCQSLVSVTLASREVPVMGNRCDSTGGGLPPDCLCFPGGPLAILARGIVAIICATLVERDDCAADQFVGVCFDPIHLCLWHGGHYSLPVRVH
jgi:hypothetical protein